MSKKITIEVWYYIAVIAIWFLQGLSIGYFMGAL